MYGGSLPVAYRKRKSKKKATSEAADYEKDFEPQPRKPRRIRRLFS